MSINLGVCDKVCSQLIVGQVGQNVLICPVKLTKLLKDIVDSLKMELIKLECKMEELKSQNNELKEREQRNEALLSVMKSMKVEDRKKQQHIVQLEELLRTKEQSIQLLKQKIIKYNKRNQNLAIRILNLKEQKQYQQHLQQLFPLKPTKYVKHQKINQHHSPLNSALNSAINSPFSNIINQQSRRDKIQSLHINLPLKAHIKGQSIITPRFIRRPI